MLILEPSSMSRTLSQVIHTFGKQYYQSTGPAVFPVTTYPCCPLLTNITFTFMLTLLHCTQCSNGMLRFVSASPLLLVALFFSSPVTCLLQLMLIPVDSLRYFAVWSAVRICVFVPHVLHLSCISSSILRLLFHWTCYYLRTQVGSVKNIATGWTGVC